MRTASMASSQWCAWKVLANLALCQAIEGHIFSCESNETPLSTPTHGRPQEQLGGIKWHLFLYWLWPQARNSIPKTQQPAAHMSSGIDCDWSPALTVDRMWMIHFSIKEFLKDMEELFIYLFILLWAWFSWYPCSSHGSTRERGEMHNNAIDSDDSHN